MTSPGAVTVGVLALQGAFTAHISVLRTIGVETTPVKTAEQLAAVDALVIPGGESTTMSMLLVKGDCSIPPSTDRRWSARLRNMCRNDPVLVTDSRRPARPAPPVRNRHRFEQWLRTPDRPFEADLRIDGLTDPFPGVFIRAPIVDWSATGSPCWARWMAKLCSVNAVLLPWPRSIHRRWLTDAGVLDVGVDPSADDSEEVTP